MNYPPELTSLLKSCKWPRYDFTLEGVTTKLKLLKMFPEECGNLILNPAPFVTMKEEAKILDNIKNEDWVKLFLNVDNPNESIIIGWFGYGADTALIVDCSNDDYEVKKYVFNRYWKSLGTYSEFHNLLKLDKVKFKKFE